jgi:alpha-glucosidase
MIILFPYSQKRRSHYSALSILTTLATLAAVLLSLTLPTAWAQSHLTSVVAINSPSSGITATISLDHNATGGTNQLYLGITKGTATFLQPSQLGISFATFALSAFSGGCSASSTGSASPTLTWLTGKSLSETYSYNYATVTCTHSSGAYLVVTIRVSDDGVAFQYEPYVGSSSYSTSQNMTSEFTEYILPSSPTSDTNGYLQNARDSYNNYEDDNELYYGDTSSAGFPNEESYPALFNLGSSNWMLLTESATDVGYPDGHLAKDSSTNDVYHQWFRDLGTWQPSFTLPFLTPWRIIILGGLQTIAQSDLVRELGQSQQSGINFSFVSPGYASASAYAGCDSYNRAAVDAAVALNMDWVHFDYGWDQDACITGSGTCTALGNQSPIAYAHSNGLKVQLWNSAATSDPNTPTNPSTVISSEGPSGYGADSIEVDFMEGYQGLGAAENPLYQYKNLGRYVNWASAAANAGMDITFNGNYAPRGIESRFPNVLGQEGILGTEHYYCDPTMTACGPTPTADQNNILTYTRLVLGTTHWLDDTWEHRLYQSGSVTTRGHTLALSVVFDEGINPSWGADATHIGLAEGPATSSCSLQADTDILSNSKDWYQNLPNKRVSNDRWWLETKWLGGAPAATTILGRLAQTSSSKNLWYVTFTTANSSASTYNLAVGNVLDSGDTHTYSAYLYYDTPSSDSTCTTNGGTLTSGGANENISKCTITGVSASTTFSSIQVAAYGGFVLRLAQQ